MSSSLPNIVLIYPDQMRYDSTSRSGNKLVKTPAFDALAEAGAYFENAYTSFPLCCPFRASLMSGAYAHSIGMCTNHYPINLNWPGTFLPQAVKTRGYETAWIGKWHLNGGNKFDYVPREYRLGFDEFIGYSRGHHMSELYELGHREIAYLGEIRKESRYKGYIEFSHSHDIKTGKELVVDTSQTLEGGYRGACELLRRGADFSAIFCANDETAMGAIKGLWDKGIKVPEDVSVISIDDIEMARYFTPMLTTVHIPIDELGRHTAKTLIDRIEKGHTLPVKIALPFTLSRRDSCAPKKRGSGPASKNKEGKEESQK